MISIETEFDKLLGGGLQKGTLTHIYGPPASGKTNIALIATYNAAIEGKVVYVDPEGGFSTERLKQIAGENFEKVLSNILLIEPTTFDEQKVAISKIDDIISKNLNLVNLVVVDGIAMLYRLQEDKDVRELGRMLAQLLRISRKYEIPVLMTNQVYTDIDSSKMIPVGGDITKYWCKIVIELGKEDNLRYAVLHRHKFVPDEMKLYFRIIDSGIEALGYPGVSKF